MHNLNNWGALISWTGTLAMIFWSTDRRKPSTLWDTLQSVLCNCQFVHILQFMHLFVLIVHVGFMA